MAIASRSADRRGAVAVIQTRSRLTGVIGLLFGEGIAVSTLWGPGSASYRVLMITYIVVALVWTVRTLRAGIVITAEGVTIRSVPRTWVVPWTEIAGFEKAMVLFWYSPRRAAYVGTRLTDGRCLRTMGAVSSRPRNQLIDKYVDELEQYRRHYLAG